MSEGSSQDAEESAETALRSRVKAALFDGESLDKLGRFEIVERLGAGGMGVVYRARDPSLDRDVAIKVLASFGSLGTSGRSRLQREARAMAKLSHPNVAHVYEVAAEGDEVYVAMEYIDGPTLKAWTHGHRDDQDAILSMYKAAGEGLWAAHRAGFVHRDFKPDNVLVGSDDRPRVLDFGLATALADGKQELDETRPPDVADLEKSLTATGAILGTPAYMAPEQFLGKVTDQRTDQFAFCVALWEALTGSRPFAGDSFNALRSNVVRERLPDGPVDGLPPRIETALRRGLSADPKQRFPTMRALLDVLSASTSPSSRNAWMVIAGAAVALLGFAVLTADTPDKTQPATDEQPAKPVSKDAAQPPAPEPLELEIITNTTGYGVSDEHMHADGRRYLYRAEGAYWVAEIDGGLPKRLELPPGGHRAVRFHGPDQYIALTDEGQPVAFLPGKPARPLPFRAPPNVTAIELSPSADALLSTTIDGVWLGTPNAKPVRVVRKRRPVAIAWSTDGQRFAALVEEPEAGEHRVYLFTRAGKRIAHEQVSPTLALAWVGPNQLLIGASEDGHPTGVQCYRVTDRGLRRRELVPVPALTSLRYAMKSTAAGRLLFEVETSSRRDVAVASIETPRSRHDVAPGLPARNWAPEWIDERRLAIASDRFGRGMLFIHDVETQHTGDPHPMEGYYVNDCSVYAEDRLVCRVSDLDGAISLATFDVHSDTWTRLDADDTWVGSTEALGCTRSGRCLVSTSDPSGIELRTLDPSSGASNVLRACPPQIACRYRWTLDPEGGLLLTRTPEQDRLAWFALETGDVRYQVIPDSDGYIVQSAAQHGDRILASQMTSDGAEVEQTYRIVAVNDGATEVLVGHDHEWMVSPRISPDGERFAYGFLSFHFELATADASGLCR